MLVIIPMPVEINVGVVVVAMILLMLVLIVDYVDFTMILTKIGRVFEEGKVQAIQILLHIANEHTGTQISHGEDENNPARIYFSNLLNRENLTVNG